MRKLYLLISILFVALLAVGCGSTTATTAGTDAQVQPTVEKIKWTLQSSWPEGSFNQEFPKLIADDILKATGGRLEIEVLPGGAIVAAGEVLDAVNSGTIDMSHTWPGYFAGKMPEIGIIASQVAGLTPTDMMSYMLQGGGNEMFQEILDKGGNKAKIFTSGIIPAEIFMQSNKPIQSIADLKGLKVRATGDWGAIIARLGASPVSLSLGETFPALERGVVDAAEYGSPALNYSSGIQDLTKFVVFPGVHQTSTINTVLISKKKWDALPADLQAIVTMVVRDNVAKHFAKWQQGDIEALEKYREMEKAGKLQMTTLPADFQKQVAEESKKYFEEMASKSEMSKKVYDSIESFKKKAALFNAYQKFDY